jgi:hypothetical protein
MLSCVMAARKREYLGHTVNAFKCDCRCGSIGSTSRDYLRACLYCPPVLQKAADEGIVLLHSNENTYTVVGKLYELGVK